MRSGLYLKIAWNNLKKNYRFFIPQILTGTGLLGAFYICMTLTGDKRVSALRGGAYIPTFMGFGTFILGVLSLILILYTNSFVTKQREKEFGLYNILGMEKRHVIRVMFLETLLSDVISMVSGLFFGMLLYKLSTLFICSLLKVESIIGFQWPSLSGCVTVILIFAAIYAFSFLVSVIRISRMKPVEMMKSDRTGEKEPKIKWPLFVIGLAALAAGYIMATTVHSPLQAIVLFFAAVGLVILGTYFLFVAGSIFVLKALKKSKSYYYHKKHMTAVAGLLYRMKQNAVGLASICIMSTCVLVLISCTVCLYSGMNQLLETNYPQQLYLMVGVEGAADDSVQELSDGELTEIVVKAADVTGVEVQSLQTHKFLSCSALMRNGDLYITSPENENLIDMSQIAVVTYITAAQYEEYTGTHIDLLEGEAAFVRTGVILSGGRKQNVKEGSSVCFGDQKITFVKELNYYPIPAREGSITTCFGVILPNDATLDQIDLAQQAAYGKNASNRQSRIAADFSEDIKELEIGRELQQAIRTELLAYMDTHQMELGYQLDTVWEAEGDYAGMYGTFLFLGVLLGFVFLFATVLVIYYKQISEGYEDRKRYQIMEKIGMSGQEIQGTISTQTLLVFFLPLVTAGIHICFAFPILSKLLQLLMMASITRFVICTAAVYVIFALVYVLIYLLTARTYYRIVK